MAFQKGQSKPANSGRKKGSLNKKTVLRVESVLAEKDINPTEEILKLIEELETPQAKLYAWFELLSYTQAKPKEDVIEEKPASDDQEVLKASDILDLVDVTPKEIEKK